MAAFLLAALTVASTFGGDTRDWPGWRGRNTDGTIAGGTTFEAPFELRVRWKRELGTGYSGIAVAAGHAVTMFSSGGLDYVVSLDADSGEENWRLAIGATFPGRDGAVDGPLSTPAIHEGRVFALGPHGQLVAARLDSGETLWSTHLADRFGGRVPHWGYASSPVVIGGRLVVSGAGAEDGAVVAFDPQTGEAIWRALNDEVHYQSPASWERGDGRVEVVAAGATTVAGIDVRTGELRWTFAHEGEGFYPRVINPVRVGADGWMLVNRPDESRLVRVSDTGGPATVEPVWSSPHIRRNYATPVAYRGHVYGFNRGFLSSIDVATGELAWKSRPPGNGFPILVDGYLVILTKNGSLHVAPAEPDGYRELARLEVFDRLVWTPPSFAAGRIYARDSFGQIACVDVVPSSKSTETAPDPAPGTLPFSRFEHWVRSLENSPDAEARVREFLDTRRSFPIYEGDRWVHVVYHGEVDDLVLVGDMLDARDSLAMHRVRGTELHYASFELEPDARVHYRFVKDLTEPLEDPLNPRSMVSMIYGGRVSPIRMPRSRAVRPGVETDELRGSVEEIAIETSETTVGELKTGGERKLWIYLPEGYADGDERYPVLYALYGEQMLKHAHMDELTDRLTGSSIRPTIVVMVQVTSAYEYARSVRHGHREDLVERVVPLIDDRFRTLDDPEHRALLGVDEAGYFAMEVGLLSPGTFGKIAAQSPLAIEDEGRPVLDAIVEGDRLPVRFFLDWGRYDQRRPEDLTDVPAYSRRLRDLLSSRGYEVAWREWNDGSDTELWSSRIAGILEAFFPIADAPE